jgi:hypothetical protein
MFRRQINNYAARRRLPATVGGAERHVGAASRVRTSPTAWIRRVAGPMIETVPCGPLEAQIDLPSGEN